MCRWSRCPGSGTAITAATLALPKADTPPLQGDASRRSRGTFIPPAFTCGASFMRRVAVLFLAGIMSAGAMVAAQGALGQAGPTVPALSAPITLPSAVPEKFTRNVFAGDKVRQRIFVPC